MTQKSATKRYFIKLEGQEEFEIPEKVYNKNKHKKLKGIRYYKRDSVS